MEMSAIDPDVIGREHAGIPPDSVGASPCFKQRKGGLWFAGKLWL